VASVPVLAQSEIFNPMKDAIKAGDGAALTKTFAPAVDINLEGNINTYSKAQSEFVLKDFFKKHPRKLWSQNKRPMATTLF
jgi:hypothetical protein